jgi:DNA-binding SARP family transcriptional activator
LRTYHACATTLVRELGVEPSSETRDAYEALLEIVPGPDALEVAPPALSGAPLVGRQPEPARLAQP